MRAVALHGVVVILQKNLRRWLAMRNYKKTKKCVIYLQACVRRKIAMRKYNKTLDAIVIIQAFFRMVCGTPAYFSCHLIAIPD